MELADVEKIAKLARIDVPKNEQKELLKDMESILGYVEKIGEVATDEKKPEVGSHRNIMRDDAEPHEPEKHTEVILKEAPKTKDGYIEVKKIL